MWTRLHGSYRPSWRQGNFRVTRLRARQFSLASWQADCQYWRFLGEFETLCAAKERAALIDEIENRDVIALIERVCAAIETGEAEKPL